MIGPRTVADQGISDTWVFGNVALAVLLLSGCACEKLDGISRDGEADEDHVEANDPWVVDGPCGSCDDGTPCTLDLCNPATLECRHIPMDMDGDGHVPIWTVDGAFCGGDDCDDSRLDVHAGAAEVCGDGVDQDCDGSVDGLRVMGPDVRLTASPDTVSDGTGILWAGSEWVVRWWDEDIPDDVSGADISLLRLDPTGVPVGEPRLVASGAYRFGNASMAWTGSRIGLAWPGADFYFDTYTITGEREVHVGTGLGATVSWMVWTGSEFGLAMGETGYSFASFGPDGPTSSAALSLVDRDSWVYVFPPALAWTGSEFVMVGDFLDVDPPDDDLQMARISRPMTLVEDPVRLTDTGASDHPGLAWTGSELGLLWRCGYTYFTRLDAMGERVSEDRIVSGWSSRSAIAWTGSLFGVAWSMSGDPGESWIGILVLDPSGEPTGESLTVSHVTSMQLDMDMAWSGSEFGLVWSDGRFDDTPCLLEGSAEIMCNVEVVFNRVGFCQ